jgi:hypothetical protein
VSKINYLLIFLIITTLGVIFWLFVDNKASLTDLNKSLEVPSIGKGEKIKDDGYIQGYIEVPDLIGGFKRCLNRGYTDLFKKKS